MSSIAARARKLRPKPNYTTSIVSVSLVLFLLGLFALISSHSTELADYFKERINIIVELRERIGEKEVARVRELLERSPQVKPSSIEFVSREDAAKLLAEDFGEDFLLLDMPNPLFDVFTFNVEGQYLNKTDLHALKADLKRKSDLINDVYFQETMVDSVLDNVERISYFILILGVVFVFVAIALIHNSIKLALYANRMLIKNMELVGASWGFIRRPFLARAFVNGLLSGLIACLLLSGCILFLMDRQPGFRDILNDHIVMGTLGGVILCGILLTVISTFFTVGRYLRMRLDELF